MTEQHTNEGAQQRLGRRLGLEPYYVVVERESGLLRLESRPEANRPAGLRIIAGAAGIVIVAIIVAVSGLTSAAGGAGFAVAALAAVVAGLIGGLGYQRATAGYAVLTTHNAVVCDAEAGTLTFHQASKVGAARSQLLRLAQIGELRLRRRPLAAGWPIRQVRPIVAIELLVGEHIWVVDTAADAEALRPTAEALATALGRDFTRAE
jgi:hypothetical protein